MCEFNSNKCQRFGGKRSTRTNIVPNNSRSIAVDTNLFCVDIRRHGPFFLYKFGNTITCSCHANETEPHSSTLITIRFSRVFIRYPGFIFSVRQMCHFRSHQTVHSAQFLLHFRPSEHSVNFIELNNKLSIFDNSTLYFNGMQT